MRSKFNFVVLFLFVLINILLIGFEPVQAEGSVYYLDGGKNRRARDRPNYGTESNPWKTFEYALQQLGPGDTLLVREGSYEAFTQTFFAEHSGTQTAPITIKRYPGDGEPVISSRETKIIKFSGTQWWTFEELVFESQTFVLGATLEKKAEHITFRDCLFQDASYMALRILYAEDTLIERTGFKRIQSEVAGEDRSAITVPYYANNLTIRDSYFEDISSDGIQLGRSQVSITNVLLENNKFYIQRKPDGSLADKKLDRQWGNLGENGIDIKEVDGPVIVRGNEIFGFRPTVPGQNASGGDGEGIVLHYGSRNVIIEQNLFHDNTEHLTIATASGIRRTESIIVRNNIFQDAQNAINDGIPVEGSGVIVRDAAYVEIYHNTFYQNPIIFKTNRVTDSIFKNNAASGGWVGFRSSVWVADYNAWSQLTKNLPQEIAGANDITVSSLELDVDLNPLETSPLINQGTTVGVVDDYLGFLRDTLPDMGAYEYQGVSMVLSGQSSQTTTQEEQGVFLPMIIND